MNYSVMGVGGDTQPAPCPDRLNEWNPRTTGHIGNETFQVCETRKVWAPGKRKCPVGGVGALTWRAI